MFSVFIYKYNLSIFYVGDENDFDYEYYDGGNGVRIWLDCVRSLFYFWNF